MKESDFYQRHVRKMSGVLHLERIESALGSGFPDISAAGGGKQFLIETKVSKTLEGQEWLFFERFQLAFFKKRQRFTGNRGLFILALCGERVMLWPAHHVVCVKTRPYKKWNLVMVDEIKEEAFYVDKPFTKADMEHLAETMISLS